MWDPVPWMVAGGALHSTNVARNVAYAAFGGREGVVDPKGLEVRATTPTGPQVEVWPGTVAIQHRGIGIKDEMYVGNHTALSEVDIAPTGATGRSDLIVVRVEDPNEPGSTWEAPADPVTGPYIFTRVISNVPATTRTAADLGLGHSMIALARIDIPANTATITQSMVTDLRQLTHSRAERAFRVFSTDGTENVLTWSYSTWQTFPSVAILTTKIPSWATHVRGIGQVAGILAGNNANANQTTGIATLGFIVPGVPEFELNHTYWATDASVGMERLAVFCGGEGTRIPEAARGKTVTIHLKFQRGAGDNMLQFWWGGTASIDVDFYQQPESNA